MTPVRLIDSSNLELADWPQGDSNEGTRKYLIPLIQRGVPRFVSNAHVEVAALVVDRRVLPVVISDGRRGDAAVCCVRSHFVDYPAEELVRHRVMLRRLIGGLLKCVGFLMDRIQVGRAVYVNHWLWTTDPCPDLSHGQIESITRFLIERFPDRAIVFRGVADEIVPGIEECFKKAKYALARGRRVFRYDPLVRKTENLRRDLGLLKTSPYKLRRVDNLSEEELAEVTGLYRELYLGKYSELNPHYTPDFFRLVAEAGLFRWYLICSGHRQIRAFLCYLLKPTQIILAFVGYDRRVPQKDGLYRQAIAVGLRDSRVSTLPAMMSSGAGSFKQARGAVAVTEHHAVYGKHLSLPKRAAWACLTFVMNAWQRLEYRFF